jgi:hypothetical protein
MIRHRALQSALIGLTMWSAGTGDASAQATNAARVLAVRGSTPQVCSIANGELQAGQLINFNGISGDTLQVTQLLDPSTLSVRPASATISFNAVCNYPHLIRLESQNNGLWPTDGRLVGTAPGFANALPYDASITWGPATARLETDAKVRSNQVQRLTVDQPTAGAVTLRLAILAGASNSSVNAPVLAGVYGDTLRIFLEPR